MADLSAGTGVRRGESWFRFAESEAAAFVERVDEVDVAGRDELVFDEEGGGSRLLLEDGECEGDDLVAVTLRKVGDGADEARVGAAQLVAGVEDGVLADDGAFFAGSGFVEGTQGGEGADVVDGADEGAFGGGAAKVLAKDFEDLFEVAAAVEVDDGDAGEVGQLGAEAVDEACDAEFDQGAGDGEFEQKEAV